MDEIRGAEFTACWHANADKVLAYAVRHVGFDGAQDVVSETFLHAWRRWDHIPEPALPWLLGTARRVVGNRRRGSRRRLALSSRLAFLDEAADSGHAAEVLATDRQAALAALAGLSSSDREVLLLVAWDGLSAEQAADVLGMRPGTFRIRVHRARKRLAEHLQADDCPSTEEEQCPTKTMA